MKPHHTISTASASARSASPWARVRFIGLAAPLLLSGIALCAAAAPLRLVVDRTGALHVPAAALHRMGVKPATNGLVCIQFPFSVLKQAKVPKGVHLEPTVPESPPRVWAPLAKDGSLALRKTRLIPGTEIVPGAPGTVYLASGAKGRLVLQKPARR